MYAILAREVNGAAATGGALPAPLPEGLLDLG